MFKKFPVYSIIAFLLFSACKKSAQDNITEPAPEGIVLKSGAFVSNSKATSGTAKIIRGADNKTRLVFENLSTGNGPDVRVWLSPNLTTSSYQEVGLLKAVSGSFSYELGANIDYTTNNRVLIWCEDFAVLFGHAVLQ
jgi:hypothetical protein